MKRLGEQCTHQVIPLLSVHQNNFLDYLNVWTISDSHCQEIYADDVKNVHEYVYTFYNFQNLKP